MQPKFTILETPNNLGFVVYIYGLPYLKYKSRINMLVPVRKSHYEARGVASSTVKGWLISGQYLTFRISGTLFLNLSAENVKALW